MIYRLNIIKVMSWFLLLQAHSLTWSAAPPNPTESDTNRNTAGGTSALINNVGFPDNGFSADNSAFGFAALKFNTTGFNNTAVGSGTLAFNTTGYSNTAIGVRTLMFNTTGYFNSGLGAGTLYTNTTGFANTASGFLSLLYNTIGNNNTANGYETLYFNTIGIRNVANGASALRANTTGNYNTAIGDSSLLKNTTGSGNSVLGIQALMNQITGNYNLALGINAGLNLSSGSNNIYLANSGAATESSTIRIGNAGHTRTFIGGIRARSTGLANAVPVVIDSNGQLGTVNSSIRFKKDIKDMDEVSHKLLQLRPVTYRYKQAAESGANPVEYGLIAEEVAKVYPDLVAYSADGKIETVQYQKLTPMLLNELQRTNRLLQSDDRKIQQLTQEIANLKKQAQEVAHLKQQVTSLQTQVQKFELLLSARSNRIEAQQIVGINR